MHIETNRTKKRTAGHFSFRLERAEVSAPRPTFSAEGVESLIFRFQSPRDVFLRRFVFPFVRRKERRPRPKERADPPEGAPARFSSLVAAAEKIDRFLGLRIFQGFQSFFGFRVPLFGGFAEPFLRLGRILFDPFAVEIA